LTMMIAVMTLERVAAVVAVVVAKFHYSRTARR